MPYFVTDDDCRLYYTFAQPGSDLPVIVFLNGLAQTTTYWHGQAKFFSENYRVLRYDGRAQGSSDPGKASLSPDRHITDLVALFHHLDIDAASLVGLSHGAYIAMAFTVRHPEMVNKLIVCNLRAGRYGDSDIVARWVQKLTGEGLEAYARDVITAATGKTFRAGHRHLIPMMARAVAARNSAKGLVRQLEAMQAYQMASEIAGGVTTPALVIYGGEDEIVPPEDAVILADRMNASTEKIGQAGHSLPVEAPAKFNSIIRDFLNPAT
ncbi:MAG: alpha/beta fold hydrolase [Desulfobacterales bacterium]|nr:alpha/beta fold hydrolase [Desulfobacterales bacterium]